MLSGWTPGHHCRTPIQNESFVFNYGAYENGNSSSISVDIFNGTHPQCHYTKERENETFPCDNGWIYDIHPGRESSVVTEVNTKQSINNF